MEGAFGRFADAAERLAGAVAGACVLDAYGGLLYERNADEAFPAASVIKVPLVMALHVEAASDALSLEERVGVGERVDGSGILRDLTGLSDVSLRDLAMLAIGLSDNTATNRLIERVGIDRVNALLDDWGCPASRLRRRMYDFAAAKRGLENVMTPRETASLLLRVLRRECNDAATSARVLALLERCQDSSMLRRYLPAAARVANKTGSIEGSRNDAAIVWAERPVIVAAFLRGLSDPVAGEIALGVLGWCAYRAAGGDVSALPPLPAEGIAGA